MSSLLRFTVPKENPDLRFFSLQPISTLYNQFRPLFGRSVIREIYRNDGTLPFKGAYLLKAYGLDWSSERFWKTYVLLTRVEEGFRCLKSELGLRPVYHQITRRVEGHLFITVIAYHIMQTILYQLRQSGIDMRWKTLRHEMVTQVRVTTTMRAKDGRQLRVRSSTLAEPTQKDIYLALGISPSPGRTIKTFV